MRCFNSSWISRVFLLFIIVGAIFYIFFILIPQKKIYDVRHVSIHGAYLIQPLPLKNFVFHDVKGNKFTKENLLNHWTLLYMGFTHCEMICPATMGILARTFQALKSRLPEKDLPQIVFVSIDPERDTVEKIKKFVLEFNPTFIGLRGSSENTALLAKQLHVLISRKPLNNDYTLDHGTAIVLINPAGKIQAWFTWPHQPARISEDYLNITSKYEVSGNAQLSNDSK